jgi:hypothetical protein
MTYPTIPQEEQEGLILLANLPENQVEQLQRALTVAPVVVNRDTFLKGVSRVEGLSSVDQDKITSALAYLNGYLVAGNIDLEEFIKDVGSSLAEENVSGDVVRKIENALPRLLDIDTIRLRAKAVDLQVDHAKAFQSVRILTDVRPVFAPKSTSEVKGALIFHSLKIDYFCDTETSEIFISLDDHDLALLRQAIDRAEAKARTLRAILTEKLEVTDFGSTDSA